MDNLRSIIQNRIDNFTATKKVFDDNNIITSKIYGGHIEILQSILDEYDGKTDEVTQSSTIDQKYDIFAQKLCDQFGESIVNDDSDENNPYEWWLQDVTVTDIVDFVKENPILPN